MFDTRNALGKRISKLATMASKFEGDLSEVQSKFLARKTSIGSAKHFLKSLPNVYHKS